MDRRTDNRDTAFRAVIADAGESLTSISQATGIPTGDLTHVDGLTVDQLTDVGGFLSLPPSALIGAGA